jgi:outer membrane protein OmpA-like peptidoglycan-associated protein
MSHKRTSLRKLASASLVLMTIVSLSHAQTIQRPEPTFWWGVSGAANFNFYSGTTQTLNSDVMAPSAFHKGFGVGPYGSILMEYRPNRIWGFMMNIAYDDRSAKFDGETAPCNCPEGLKTNLTYLTFEPSLRIAPFSDGFYLFIGGAYSYNLNKSFTYTQSLQPDAKGDLSNMQGSVFSGQVGAGYDIPLSAPGNPTQLNLSPFVSYHPYFGQEPRSVESWSLSTVRVGVALKFGKVRPLPPLTGHAEVVPADVKFTITAPAAIPVRRNVKETFPLSNLVFFDEGSVEIPKRYVKLNKEQAVEFHENQFQDPEPKDIDGRSDRQMTVYHNILNIVGDRMRKNPTTTITLVGSSAGKGVEQGKEIAESAKRYLVDVFGISGSRIVTEGREEPKGVSLNTPATRDLNNIEEGHRRLDIISTSPVLLAPLQITAMQDDPIESRVVFKNAGANGALKSWTLDITDENGKLKHFGPFTRETESISGNVILGDRQEGNYKVVMIGQGIDGSSITKESNLHLVHGAKPKEDGLRFSVIFRFDQVKTVAAYDKFLKETVGPSIPDGGTVIIHGHTDVIGDEDHNLKLSEERAKEIKDVLQAELTKEGKNAVLFEVYGFGSSTYSAPFDNTYPEERSYNRTVIIDVVPNK